MTKVVFLKQILPTFGGSCNRCFWNIWLKILRLPNFNMLFQLVRAKCFKRELFSCLPKVDHVIKSCKEPINQQMLILINNSCSIKKCICFSLFLFSLKFDFIDASKPWSSISLSLIQRTRAFFQRSLANVFKLEVQPSVTSSCAWPGTRKKLSHDQHSWLFSVVFCKKKELSCQFFSSIWIQENFAALTKFFSL